MLVAESLHPNTSHEPCKIFARTDIVHRSRSSYMAVNEPCYRDSWKEQPVTRLLRQNNVLVGQAQRFGNACVEPIIMDGSYC